MGALEERLHGDLSAAIKGRDQVAMAALRMALTAVRNEQVAGPIARELSEQDVVKVLTREVKKRREAAQAFADGGRPDRAERERAEGAVLERYLPAQLGDEELADLVRRAIAETGAAGPRAIGQVMKVVQPTIAGRAEGGRVAAEVRRQLSG